jgi:hypothetical protein
MTVFLFLIAIALNGECRMPYHTRVPIKGRNVCNCEAWTAGEERERSQEGQFDFRKDEYEDK